MVIDNLFTKVTFNNNITATKHGAVKRSTTIIPNENNLEILRERDGQDGSDGLPGANGIVGLFRK